MLNQASCCDKNELEAHRNALVIFPRDRDDHKFPVRIITGMDRNAPERTGRGLHNLNGYKN